MRPGLHALVSLDGARLAEADLVLMGLEHAALAEGLAAHAMDPQAAAVDLHRTGDAVTLLAGYLDEPAELAGSLGMDAGTPPAALAAAALARFGKQAAVHMLGEWSLLHWSTHTRELTLVAAQAIRDPIFFAFQQAGSLVAMAPSAMQLGSLPWVGRTLDPTGFALNSSRAGLRHIRTTETIWRGIRLVQPGSTETFRQGQRTSVQATPQAEFERWEGGFDEGAEALDAVGRRIIRQHMERPPISAFLLSGGLDSTLLNCWGALERGPGRGLAIPETRSWLRLRVAGLRDEIVRRQRFSGWPAAAFHVRLHPDLMATLPPDWARVWRKGVPRNPKPGRTDPPMGIDRMAAKLAPASSAGENGIRSLLPYRDRRLMRLAARMPVSFLSHEGMTRPLARRLLLGRVPDLVRLRDSFMPFSPDYVPRLKRQAAGVHKRIGLYREAGIDRWLDLDWLNEALVRLAASRDERDYDLY